MKKRVISLLLILCLVGTFLPLTASAAEIVDSGKFKYGNISWTLDSDGLLTISGSGQMSPCNLEAEIPWFQYSENITAAVVEDGITNIGYYCFNKCYRMKTVSIPDSVTSIDPHAFYWCRGLTEITLPSNLEVINTLAFYNCDNLQTIHFGDSLTTIGINAFDCCRGLTEITLPASLESIHSYAFRSCENLETVTFLGDAPEITSNAFSGNGMFSNMVCRYPAGNPTWTDDVMNGYGGRVTWVPYETSDSASIPGDLNDDSSVDDTDVALLLWHTLFPDDYEISGNADFNGDGSTNDADVAYLLWHTLFPQEYPL